MKSDTQKQETHVKERKIFQFQMYFYWPEVLPKDILPKRLHTGDKLKNLELRIEIEE